MGNIFESISYYYNIFSMGYDDTIKLTRIAIKSKNVRVCLAAVERLYDKVLLEEIARYSRHPEVRELAAKRAENALVDDFKASDAQ